MAAAQQREAQAGTGSNGWQAAGEQRSNGWPFGLQLGRRMSRQLEQHLFASTSLYTPSITSDSSSDLDTQSTGSFFPEKSTTLGSLIGIQSNSSHNDPAMAEAHQMLEAERRKSGGAAGVRASWASWCSMLGCGGGSNPEALGMSPSLAHLLEEERRASTGSQRGHNNTEAAVAHVDMEEFEGGEALMMETPSNLLGQRNTLFDGEGILPPHPSGAPLRLILQHTSPGSSYPSADWDVFNSGHHGGHHSRGAGSGGSGGGGGGSRGRFPATSWRSSLCGRLASDLGDVL